MAALSRASLRIWQLVYFGNIIFRYHVVDAIPLPVDESGWTLTGYDSYTSRQAHVTWYRPRPIPYHQPPNQSNPK
jgi:hypothetical protein